MPANLIDLTGHRFQRWLVIERASNAGRYVRWLCRCDCGTERIVRANNLRTGSSQSCGCHRSERMTTLNQITTQPRYSTVHSRLNRSRGKASDHRCVDCGGKARHWSYQGACLDEAWDVVHGQPLPMAYCLVPHEKCYAPRCVSCHREYDKREN